MSASRDGRGRHDPAGGAADRRGARRRDGRGPARRTRAAAPPGSSGSTAARLERVRAHGKNLLLDFGELALHSHLGMSGSWHVYRPASPGASPPARPGRCSRGGGVRSGPVRRPDPARPPIPAPRPGPGAPRPRHPRPGPRPASGRLAAPAPERGSSATPCSTRPWSPASATSSRARPASRPRLDPWRHGRRARRRGAARRSSPRPPAT